MADPKETTLQRMGTEVVSGGKLDVIDELWAADVVDHDPAPGQPQGAEGIKAFWSNFRTAFPDLKMSVDASVADGDMMAIAYTATGTHSGPFLGHDATGKSVTVKGLQMSRHDADGKIVERWGSSDVLGVLQQIGAA